MIKRSVGKWFSHYKHNENAKINLFCFVFAGGSPTFFSSWKNVFSDEINVLPVIYPFREKRMGEPMPKTVDELVRTFINENKKMLSAKPWGVWGHCSGALIGFETAYALKDSGNPASFFIVSGCESPASALDRLMLSSDFSQITDGDILNDLLLFDLVDADLVKDEDFKRYFFPIYRADLEMFRNYIYDSNKKMEIPALVMNGTEDKMVSAERSRKWREYIGSRIEFAEFSGKHYFINDHVEEISRAISAFILKNA
ncbi:thioesterase domain protein [Pseudoramibacter alactolyticus ATCC 23263]|uniref:Thioesterase domain protein n=1 Tax=Pseudoramibacter alactolyticus ATCC 23263 TaxID=887929 RepID=E6MHC7_9FIRM|nr:thioesterase domain-containing protein [Pseudoramibacter alactolyticus]EFV01491.1 thioesterase domain protein [Pseudoramibacter alactolyticus ATCC 23263]